MDNHPMQGYFTTIDILKKERKKVKIIKLITGNIENWIICPYIAKKKMP